MSDLLFVSQQSSALPLIDRDRLDVLNTSQDNEGQTALHYASACEFAEIVDLLLSSGADPSIKDLEGSLPEEVTESSAISSLLQQHTAPKG
ncbi:hypothetical protein JOQ06_008929 [Pogonophryne albipinna]|uniref:Uncharacterized protein n=2 Tax=Pogonophryne albipinna TaxID=1090488 RepID=A0AAD6BPJ1_9TELE|nr:hypothetical protein JOQ06_008929 [Pogonophryne albipinna]